MQAQPIPPEVQEFFAVFGVFFLIAILVGLAITVVMVIAWCMIFKRAGYSWALGLLTLVPIANVVVILVLAFSRWPIQRQLDELGALAGRGAAVGPPAAAPLR